MRTTFSALSLISISALALATAAQAQTAVATSATGTGGSTATATTTPGTTSTASAGTAATATASSTGVAAPESRTAPLLNPQTTRTPSTDGPKPTETPPNETPADTSPGTSSSTSGSSVLGASNQTSGTGAGRTTGVRPADPGAAAAVPLETVPAATGSVEVVNANGERLAVNTIAATLPEPAATTPTPQLDAATRAAGQRLRAKTARKQQLMHSIVPRTNNDRTDQMPDDPIVVR